MIFGTSLSSLDAAELKAIRKSQAVISFKPDGTIIIANDNFLDAMGYTLEEIRGQHHSLFVNPEYKDSLEYQNFWNLLRQGEFQAEQFKRLAKGGREVWIEASYNPILDKKGKVVRVVKYATDITAQKLQSADHEGQINAINKAQAVIEFEMDGRILSANSNFLDAMGYSLEEIKGRHHRMFVDNDEADSPEYSKFWDKLRLGEFDTRVYKRYAKGGREIWIQASYNPILDMNGKPFKVVKFATDVTNIIEMGNIADQTTSNVQSVAAAVEEMSAAIHEISGNMNFSREASQGILQAATNSTELAQNLVMSMQAMESVVELINNITNQVNLLALNATIEASRAGDSGKGFAVVASEVKNLAGQTTKAMEDIAQEITSVQELANTVADNINNIRDSADKVNESVTATSSAVEEQSAVTTEISGNTNMVATSVNEITQAIKALSQTG